MLPTLRPKTIKTTTNQIQQTIRSLKSTYQRNNSTPNASNQIPIRICNQICQDQSTNIMALSATKICTSSFFHSKCHTHHQLVSRKYSSPMLTVPRLLLPVTKVLNMPTLLCQISPIWAIFTISNIIINNKVNGIFFACFFKLIDNNHVIVTVISADLNHICFLFFKLIFCNRI